MLDGNGLPLTNDAYLTLSFADDGVIVAGQANALAAKFNSIAPEGIWKEAILRAFQSWALRTNADIGAVDDGGQPFGAPGASRGDSRFGDIRIAAIAMEPAIGAVSVPMDGLVGGTWLADVVFNTNFAFQSVDDIFAIALHEAGNVFGLEDNNDPGSPLHAGTIPTATEPTAADTALLQALYGTRIADANESGQGGSTPLANDSFESATVLNLNRFADGAEGSAPSLTIGDLTTESDVDFFRVDVPADYVGSTTLRLRTNGISQLLPKLTIYDDLQQLVDTAIAAAPSDNDLLITLPSTALGESLFIAVQAADTGLFAIGGYLLTVEFDNVTQADLSVLEKYSSSSLRKLSQDELSKLFDAESDDFFNDDAHEDDEDIAATDLNSEEQFAATNRFEAMGSIIDSTDADYYRIHAPDEALGQFDTLVVSIRSLDAGKLVPKLTVLNHDLEPIPVSILANGGGELIVQISGIEANRSYYLRIEAEDPAGQFNTGNYQLTASFIAIPAVLQTFAAGTLDADTKQNVHTLYVAQPQLFHFLLHADAAEITVPTTVVATIRNEAGQIVQRFAAAPGEARSAGAVLLPPGTYTLNISAASLASEVTTPLVYQLTGIAISDPFASDPNDQTNHPFLCPDPILGGAYCYPGNIITDDPYLWDNFVNSLLNQPAAIDLPALVGLLFGDWWSWVWEQTGVNGPPFAASDHYQTSRNTTLDVGVGQGVLANDAEPEGEPMVAVASSNPRSGQLTFHADGSFQFVPAPDFNGMVQFSYQASDFSQLSEAGTVSIAIGVLGDYNDDGMVSELDFLVWKTSFGSTSNLNADGNGNGTVDAGDYALWRDNLGFGASSLVASGDYDRNSIVDQLDYDVWRASFGSTTNLDADGNQNGEVDSADFTIWRDHVNQASGAGAEAAPPLAPAPDMAAAPVSVQAIDLALTSATFDAKSTVTPRRNLAVSLPPTAAITATSIQSLLALAASFRDTNRTSLPNQSANSVIETLFEMVQTESTLAAGSPFTGHDSGIQAFDFGRTLFTFQRRSPS